MWKYIKAGLIFALVRQNNVSSEALLSEFNFPEEESRKELSPFRYSAIMRKLVKVQKENNRDFSNRFELQNTASAVAASLFEDESIPATDDECDEEVSQFKNRAY